MYNEFINLSYESTGYFSKIVNDYLQQHPQLRPFYNYEVSINGIEQSIKARKAFKTNRILLVDTLKEQYKGIELSEKQKDNLDALLNENTFTITTAHQPNIFTGPLYFIYKILHAIRLADELNDELKNYHFVPVYYMGSEDADLDELGFINLNGTKLIWQTRQTGAVGRMKVDKAFIALIHSLEGQIGIHPHGKELSELFKQCYTENKTIQQATLELVNQLFVEFGLLILIPDNISLKKSFESVVAKELTEQFSHKAVEETTSELSKYYKVQAGGRELNLFYLIDDKRERIEVSGNNFQVANLKLSFTKEEILNELRNHPERFSANVILRGIFQETVLPNIAFIGGGGELAYWLELKKVFESVQVPYPVLILRNSFLLINAAQKESTRKLGFTIPELFQSETVLLNALVNMRTTRQINLTEEIAEANSLYQSIQNIVTAIDITLAEHAKALQAKALKRLTELEKKMLRAEKKKFETEQRQIQKLKQALFPNNSLQERQENFSAYYAQFGKDWLQLIYNNSKGLEQKFGVIHLSYNQ